MDAACLVTERIVRVEQLGRIEVVVCGQRHRREVVVADHGLVRAVDDCLDRQDSVLDDLA